MKKFGLIITCILAFSSLFGFSACKEEPFVPTYREETYSYTVSAGGELSYSVEQSFTLNEKEFIAPDGAYSPDMARLALSLLLYSSGARFSFLNSESPSSYPSSLGLKNAVLKSMAHGEYASDDYDLAKLLFSTRDLFDGRTTYRVIFTVIEGYIDDTGWLSNFDVGADTESYELLYGETPEWTEKVDHKGFSLTAERILGYVENYIAETVTDGATPIVFLTGHSRGGALSNLSGKYLTDKGVRCFSYGFNVPMTTCESDEAVLSSYQTLFNIVNEDDIVSEVPLAFWGFTRYGTDVNYRVSDDATLFESTFHTSHVALTDYEHEKLARAATDLIPTRDGLYEYDMRERVLKTQTETFSSVEEAKEFMTDFLSAFPANSKERACISYEIKDEAGVITATFCTRTAILEYALEKYYLGHFKDFSDYYLTFMPYLAFLSGSSGAALTCVNFFLHDGEFSQKIEYAHLRPNAIVGLTMIEERLAREAEEERLAAEKAAEEAAKAAK